MELLKEILASRRVGYRPVDPHNAYWEEMGTDEALKQDTLIARYEVTAGFLFKGTSPEVFRKARILDMGHENPFDRWIKDKHGIAVENTPADLDFDYLHRGAPDLGAFDFVFALDIIEHLMNPLLFLEFIKGHLKPNGRLYLTTPFCRPRFLWSRFHITEYYPDKIEVMSNKAGLAVERYECKKAYFYRNALDGIRPFFRAMGFERVMFFELAKNP